nr:hypothetical protein [Nakamurella antarctica]
MLQASRLESRLRNAGADVVFARKAESTFTAAKHGVTCNATAQPGRIRFGAESSDDAGPFMAKAQRKMHETLCKVGHVTGVELNIGPADTYAFDVDKQFTSTRKRCIHQHDRGGAGRADDECAHLLHHRDDELAAGIE